MAWNFRLRSLYKISGMLQCFLVASVFIVVLGLCFNLRKESSQHGKDQQTIIEKIIPSFLRKDDNCIIPELRGTDHFLSYFQKEKMKCGNLTEFGRKGYDGSKFACADERFQIPKDCIVLSFGNGNEWSFDDSMAAHGCMVYTFDPTTGKGDFKRSERVHFFNLGLGGQTITLPDSGTGGKHIYIDRYENILKKLGILDKKIYFLKLDVEGWEIDFFQDVLANCKHLFYNIQQINIDIHLGYPPEMLANSNGTLKNYKGFKVSNTTWVDIWNMMHGLECLGFKYLYYTKNPYNPYKRKNTTESQCYEITWAREN